MVAVNWTRVFNRLFELMEVGAPTDPTYYSGGRFIAEVRQVDPYFPNYRQYIAERKASGKSTSRRDYFYDILMELPESVRLAAVQTMMNSLQPHAPDKIAALKHEIGGFGSGPTAQIHHEVWNADRLNRYLADIDHRIASGNFAGAVTLAYTCLEGCFKAFVQQRESDAVMPTGLIGLSKQVKEILRQSCVECPDEALTMITHVAHTIDRSRNRFSESHFEGEAERWLAVFARDLCNSVLRLMLHFMA